MKPVLVSKVATSCYNLVDFTPWLWLFKESRIGNEGEISYVIPSEIF